MTKKMLPWEGTNQYTEKTWKQQLKSLKEIGGGQGLRKKTKSLKTSLGYDYNTKMLYNSIFEFAKAQHKYYKDSTAESRAEVYEPYKQALKHNEGKDVNISKDDMLTINSHIIKLLNDTFKKEVNKNVILQQEAKRYKERISTLERNIQDKTLENVMLDKRLKEFQHIEKNRKDKNYREQLIKISLLILFGILLYSISEYL